MIEVFIIEISASIFSGEVLPGYLILLETD